MRQFYGSRRDWNWMNSFGINSENGGRAGTRTPDLLRVKRVVGLFWFPDFYPVLITFNNLGNLLFARSATPVVVGDGVLIRF
jgi:hypothetical protein